MALPASQPEMVAAGATPPGVVFFVCTPSYMW